MIWPVLGLVLAWLGEGIFGWGIYWVALLAVAGAPWRYYYALGLGILVSLVTGTGLGLASLFLIIWLFLWERLVKPLQGSFWVTAGFVLAGEWLMGVIWRTDWSLGESLVNLGLIVFWWAGHKNEVDLRLRS